MKYPDIEVRLVGGDGNAFIILGKVIRALKSHGIPQEEVNEFREQATAGDYDHLLNTCCEWVSVS